MAIEWTIESGSAVSPNRLIDDLTRLAESVLGAAPRAVRTVGPERDEPLADFDLTIEADFGEGSGTVEVYSRWEIEDDGTLNKSYTYAAVTASRTQLSVALGIVTAIAMTALSGGHLTGGDLDEGYSGAAVEDLAEWLRRQIEPAGGEDGAVRDAVVWLSKLLGCANLSFS